MLPCASDQAFHLPGPLKRHCAFSPEGRGGADRREGTYSIQTATYPVRRAWVLGSRGQARAGAGSRARSHLQMELQMANKQAGERRLVGLAYLGKRWACSRQTCRRILERHGVRPLYLGGEARNSTLRFDLADVERVESACQVPDEAELSEPVQGSDRGQGASAVKGKAPARGRFASKRGTHDG